MKPHRTRRRHRRGFSLLLVVSTIGVLLAFWGVAHRMTASLIRVESSRLLHQTRSVQAIHAMTVLDRALVLLEIGKPTSRQSVHLFREPGPARRDPQALHGRIHPQRQSPRSEQRLDRVR